MKNKGLDNKTIAEYLSIDINDLEKLMNNQFWYIKIK